MIDAQGRLAPVLNNLRREGFLILICVAVILGGGGVRYGLMNATVQVTALGFLALAPVSIASFWKNAPFGLRILLILTVILPAVQLIPLPPGIWQAFPGRYLVSETLSLVGQPDQWMPLSLDPGRTLVAVVGLIAPAITAILSPYGRRSRYDALCRCIAALGIMTVVIGAIQLASARQAMNWFAGGNPHQLYGTFANHNSTGLFLVIALCAALGTRIGAGFLGRATKIATCLLLVAGVVLTQSRSSMALMIVPATQCILLAVHRHSAWKMPPLKTMASALILLGIIAGMAISNGRINQSFQRFDDLHDARIMIWQDSIVAIGRYWPVGSGVGTFDEVFQLDESLENTGRHKAGRAHNDFLELILESGLPGAALALSWIIYLAKLSWRLLLQRDTRISAPIFILISIFAQSLIDYPLRNQAILCIAAAMISLIASECERIRMQ